MALIGKIRDKSGLLLIVVGIAMLAFILGGWDSMFGGYKDELGIGTVYGEKIDPAAFDKEVQLTVQQDQQQAQQNQQPYTEEQQQASIDRAWNSIVEKTILQREFDALGIDCSENEMRAYLFGRDGFTLLPNIASAYTDSITGKFNPALLEKRINEMENSSKPEEVQSWLDNKKQIMDGRKQEKYNQLLGQGVYVTKLEAKHEYVAQKEIKSISFVMKRYSEIQDTEVKVTDEMVRKYYEEHKNEKKYESVTGGRDVKYFDIAVAPSRKDTMEFNKMMDNLKKGFQACKNIKEDSVFVLANSDIKFFTSSAQATFRSENEPNVKSGLTYPAYMDTTFKMAAVGQIVGPYFDKGKMRLVKIIDFNTSVNKVRHILIPAPKGDAAKMKAAQTKADSIMKFLNKDNFAENVTKFSSDQASVPKGGVYENLMRGDGYVAPFLDYAVTAPVGKIGSVETEFGIHIMEVMERKFVKYPILELIEKTLEPSSDTETSKSDEAYNLLYSFDAKISRKKELKDKIQLFDSLASKNGYFARPLTISDDNPRVTGFATSFAEDRILKLAYDENAAEGDLCSSPIKDGNKYVIAMLTSIREKGVKDFEDVEETMRYEVIKEQKAMRFIKMMTGVKSLDALSRKVNAEIMKAEINFASPQIQGAGYEPEVVGSIFSGLKNGAKTIPLKGQQGVYVVQLIKTTKAPATNNYDEEKQQMLSSMRSQLPGGARNAMRKIADVRDNRRFNQLGIRREL